MKAHDRSDGIFPCVFSLCLVTRPDCEAGIQGPQVHSMMREPAEAEMKSPPPPHNLRVAQRPNSIFHTAVFPGRPQGAGR